MKQNHSPQSDAEQMEGGDAGDGEGERGELDILYKVNERPPVPLLIGLALQQFLTMFGATFSYPLLMAPFLCLAGDTVGLSQLISTVIFTAGLATLLQTTLGVRLPIIQSSSYSFVTPFIVLLTLPEWTCQACVKQPDGYNITCGSEQHGDMWKARLRELQGALLVSSLFQILVGFTGVVGLLLRFIGPLTITPTILMIGVSLFSAASDKAQGQWWIALTTLALVGIFSQYMRGVSVPVCSYRAGTGCSRASIKLFALFPVLLAMGVSWLLCYVFTLTDVFPASDKEWGYMARTDRQSDVLSRAPWFRFPYPGQWGTPTVSVAGVLGALAATLASIVESVGDYHACARLAGAPPPPPSAINRGIGMEGITTLLAGAWGSGAGTTSYSENIGAIGITKVGSLAVVQVSGVLMLVLGCLGKFSAIFVTVPDPVVGGLFIAMFGMVAAVGISNLQYVDLNSTRNLFILGVSILMGLSLPLWLTRPANANAIDTGSSVADSVFTVLCSTSMFVAGFIAFFLDNTMPGTLRERGLTQWRVSETGCSSDQASDHYNLPLIQPWLNKMAVTRYLPFCPGFRGFGICCSSSSGQHSTSSISKEQQLNGNSSQPDFQDEGLTNKAFSTQL